MPSVSVIVPTYKHRDYVRETLATVFAQTAAGVEVIVVNDGSPDDTLALLRPLADAGRIVLIDQPNAGQAAARNRGLAAATGEFVAFLDDDDLWPPGKLAWQLDVLRGGDAVAVGGTSRTLAGDRLGVVAETGRRDRLAPAGFFGRNPFFSPGQVLVRATALRAVGGFDPLIWGSDDLDLWIRLAAYGEFAFVDRVALHYRLHAANASHAWERMLVNTRKVFAKNLPLLPAGERAAAARAGERFLYLYAASDRVQQAWTLRPARLRAAARAAGYFVRPAARQPWLAVAVARDCVPAPLREGLRRLLRIDKTGPVPQNEPPER